jgi:hypothetical protein
VVLAGVIVLIAAGLAWTARLVHIGNLDAHDLADKLSVPAPVSALDWPELHLNAVVAQPDEQPAVLLHADWPAHPQRAATLLLAQSRSVLTEVFDVPLIKKEPRAEGRRAGMNRAPDRLYHAVTVVLCVRAVSTLAENDVAGVPSGIRGSHVESRPGPRVRRVRRPYTSPEPGQAKPAQ